MTEDEIMRIGPGEPEREETEPFPTELPMPEMEDGTADDSGEDSTEDVQTEEEIIGDDSGEDSAEAVQTEEEIVGDDSGEDSAEAETVRTDDSRGDAQPEPDPVKVLESMQYMEPPYLPPHGPRQIGKVRLDAKGLYRWKSPIDKWLRIHRDGMVVLRQVVYDKSSDEYIMHEDMISRADLPRDAIKCSFEKGHYLLDHINVRYPYHDDGFTAHDAYLLAKSNKLDPNKLAASYTSLDRNASKIVVLAVIAAVAIIMVYMGVRR